MTITTHRKGNRIGVNRDGKAVGYASRVKGGTETWTAFVNIAAPPFDMARPGFTSADAAVAYIGEHGTPRS
jgi:hypothetical protein